MQRLKNLLGKMFNALEREKQNIDNFCLNESYTLTNIDRTKCYVEQLKAIIQKLNKLFTNYEKFEKAKYATSRKTREYAELINSIATEFHFLTATNKAMEDTLYAIKKSGNIQHQISGNMTWLKKQINKTVKKAGRILSE